MSTPIRRPLVALLLALSLVLAPTAARPAAAWTSESSTHSYEVRPDGVRYRSPCGEHLVPDGPFRSAHQQAGAGSGALGYPCSGIVSQGGAYRYQMFERGVVYSSARGTHAVTGDVNGIHRALGGGGGSLGYPSSSLVREAPGYAYQAFERGVVYASSAGTHVVLQGTSMASHSHYGGGGGRLGYPVGGFRWEGARHGYQVFERGVVYRSPAGEHAVLSGTGLRAHGKAGGGGGTLGYPTSGPSWSGGAERQVFERGTLHSSVGGTWVRVPTTYSDPTLEAVNVGMAASGCSGTSLELSDSLGGASALAYPWDGKVRVARGLPPVFLPYLAAHECGHMLQMWNTGGSWGDVVRRMNEIYGGTGNQGVEQNADCIAAALGFREGGYTRDCSGVRGTAASAVLAGRMP